MAVLLLSVLLGLASPVRTFPTDSVRVTYVGNEGFLVETGGKKILIDALYRTGVSGYVVHTPDVRKNLERALPPFENVDLVLATHFHADHFDPEAVGIHLLSNRNALFVTTPQAAGQMESYQGYRNIQARIVGALPEEGSSEMVHHNGIEVRLLNLHHGRGRPVENLGFLIQIGDRRVLHVGDTEIEPQDLAKYELAREGVDVFFVPYWFLLETPKEAGLVKTVGAANLIPMHIPPTDDPRGYMSETGGFEGTLALIKSNYPGAITFEDVMTTKVLP